MEKTLNDYYILPENFYPAKTFQNYIHMGVVRNYRKGDTIVLPGEIIEKVIYVLSGKLSISYLDDGRQKLMYYAGCHSIVDRLFPNDSQFIHVVSEENSRVCFFSKEQLFHIFQQNEEALTDFIKNFTTKGCYFMYEAKEMVFYNPSVRILRLLYELCISQGILVNGFYEIETKISQKIISEITGVHFVTISKIFSHLRKEKILQKTTDKIVVYDLQRLKNLIDEWMET